MGGFNNIVREHLGFNRGYYLYTMPKVSFLLGAGVGILI